MTRTEPTPGETSGFEEVHAGLRRVAGELASSEGVPVPPLEGKLLRPLVAWAAGGYGVDRRPSPGFWYGALAIQMVHEASLLHDDILDEASHRRGRPSLAARKGTGAALLQGDHLLTAAYRAAALTGSIEFVRVFTRAVERTVAGEKAQCAARGRRLSREEYLEIIGGKSGELFAAAFALPGCVDGESFPRALELGRQTGRLYQMVDDFLDLCGGGGMGKPPLQDLAQQKWTWPLDEAGLETFPDAPADEVAASFFRSEGTRASVMRRCLDRLDEERRTLVDRWAEHAADPAPLAAILKSWHGLAADALEREESARGLPVPGIASTEPARADTRATDDGLGRARGPGVQAGGNPAPSKAVDHPGAKSIDPAALDELDPAAPDKIPAAREAVRTEALRLGDREAWTAYFARHSRSFRFSARLFPTEPARLISGVYAYCRFTDDLVDADPDRPAAERRARLEAWADWTREAWEGRDTGIPLLDEVIGETAARGVPFRYIEELLAGVEMDLEPREFPDLHSLRGYSYRVASVVGLWLTELFGVRRAWVLERAEAMGHAMQLTNILRDVGEDLVHGRLYLPIDRLEHHGITREDLFAGLSTGELPSRWGELIEELMEGAELDYARAFEAIPELPRYAQRPIAVAGRVYRGIHREIRRNGYDNFGRRAYTSFPRKLIVGGAALRDLRRARNEGAVLHPGPEST